MKKLLKDPLLHFLLLGGLLFCTFEFFGPTDRGGDMTVEITSGDMKALEGNFARTWQRPPTPEELNGLIEEKVRDEIAYREAIAMGLDRDDAYIRRRLRMKMELLVEDIAGSSTPSDAELTTYLTSNRETFRQEPQVAFSHVYLSEEKHGNTLDDEIARLLEQLDAEGEGADPAKYGDAIMLPRIYPLSPVNVIARQFGPEFSKAVLDLEPGEWQGPVRSGYGLHLVLVRKMVEGYDPALADIRSVVEREMMSERRREIKEKTYDRLRQKYSVVVETQPESGS